MTMTLTATVTVRARDLRSGDVLICKDGSTRVVTHAPTRGPNTWVEVVEDERPWRVPADRAVTVRGDEPCDECRESGLYFGRKHYACGGKGHQTRADRVRNVAYWNLNGGRTR